MRIKAFSITAQCVADLCKVGERQQNIVVGAPETATFSHAWYDNESQSFVMAMVDDSFEDVPEGYRTPIFSTWDSTR